MRQKPLKRHSLSWKKGIRPHRAGIKDCAEKQPYFRKAWLTPPAAKGTLEEIPQVDSLHAQISVLYQKLYNNEETPKEIETQKKSISWFKLLLYQAAEEGFQSARETSSENSPPSADPGTSFKERLSKNLLAYSKLNPEEGDRFVENIGGKNTFKLTKDFAAQFNLIFLQSAKPADKCEQEIKEAKLRALAIFKKLEKPLEPSMPEIFNLLKECHAVLKAEDIDADPAFAISAKPSFAEIKDYQNLCSQAVETIKSTVSYLKAKYAAFCKAEKDSGKESAQEFEKAWLNYYAKLQPHPTVPVNLIEDCSGPNSNSPTGENGNSPINVDLNVTEEPAAKSSPARVQANTNADEKVEETEEESAQETTQLTAHNTAAKKKSFPWEKFLFWLAVISAVLAAGSWFFYFVCS